MAEIRTIHGVDYHVSPVPTSVGITLGARVLNSAGSVFRALQGKDKSDKTSAIASALLEHATPELITQFTSAFAAQTQVVIEAEDGTPLKSFTLSKEYEKHFAGNYGAWFEWFEFAFEVSMGSFLDAPFVVKIKAMLAQAVAEMMATKESNSKSPSPAAPNG
jgi:hypothetical protein